MNDSFFELILINKEKWISYLIDVFQENTIRSQEIIIDIIDNYRKRFKELNKDIYSLIFRRINISEKDWKEEHVIKVKDSALFFLDNWNINFWQEDNTKRLINILDSIHFKI
jgi:hypothetical protein